MAKGGRGNKAIDDVSPELRAQIDALLDVGTSPTEIYEQYPAVQAAMSLRTLQVYATDRRRERQLQIIRDERALLDGMLDLMEVDRATLSPVEQATIGVALKEMIGGGKATTRLNALDSVLLIRKDRRKTEEHALRMRLGQMQADVKQRALDAQQSDKKEDRSKGEAYAEMARMLDDLIRKRDAA